MLGVAAGVDDDQPVGRIEENAVAVRALVERHRARDQIIARLDQPELWSARAAEQPDHRQKQEYTPHRRLPFGEQQITIRSSGIERFDEAPADLAQYTRALGLMYSMSSVSV